MRQPGKSIMMRERMHLANRISGFIEVTAAKSRLSYFMNIHVPFTVTMQRMSFLGIPDSMFPMPIKGMKR